MPSIRFYVMVCAIAVCSISNSAFSNPVTSSSTRLEASQPTVGQDWKLFVFSSLPNSSFSIYATSPSRHEFEIAHGETDFGGFAEVTIAISEIEGLEGQDLQVHAVVSNEQGSSASAKSYFQFLGEEFENPEEAFTASTIESLDGLGSSEFTIAQDFNGDGWDDILVLGTDTDGNVLQLILNDGQGNLSEVHPHGIIGSSIAFAIACGAGDVDGDGDSDLVITTAESEDSNLLFLNDGTGRFEEAINFPLKSGSGLRARDVNLSDINGDGALDLILCNGIAEAHDTGEPVFQPNEILINDGQGQFEYLAGFASDAAINPPGLTRSSSVADLDLDGNVDVLFARSGTNRLLLGDGEGGFSDGSEFLLDADESTYRITPADIDLDGDLDLVLANTVFNPFAQTLLINQGGAQEGDYGRFAGPGFGQFPIPGEGQSPIRLGLYVADVDADGDQDVIFNVHELGDSEKPDLYINMGGRQAGPVGRFVLDTNFPVPGGIFSTPTSADFDRDGDRDLLIPMTGSFNPAVYPVGMHRLDGNFFTAPNTPLAFVRGDANSDTIQDISDVIFTLTHLFLGETEPACKAALDINGDDAIDISDPIAQLFFLFLEGDPPVAPFPAWGDAPSELVLPCEQVQFWQES